MQTLIVALSNNAEKKSANLRTLQSFIYGQRTLAETVGTKCLNEYEAPMQNCYNAFVASSIANLEHTADGEPESTDEDTMQDRIIREYIAKYEEEQKNKEKQGTTELVDIC